MNFSGRYVALGDSFTEGVGDWDARQPNGVRGWADRVAQQLILARPGTAQEPGWGYANLAVRGKKIRQVLAEQISPALALEPTLVSLYAGGNDILRPRIDIDALLAEYDDAVGRLAATGATVLLFTGFDAVASPVFGKMRGRTAIYNEIVREIVDRHGALLVDYWRMREFQDLRYWDTDRMHMSTAGHMLMAKKVLEVLREADTSQFPELALPPVRNRLERLREDARWVRQFAGPWVGRRLRGVSSGDSLSARYPQPVQPHWD